MEEAGLDARIEMLRRHVLSLERRGASTALLAGVALLDDVVRERTRFIRAEMAALVACRQPLTTGPRAVTARLAPGAAAR